MFGVPGELRLYVGHEVNFLLEQVSLPLFVPALKHFVSNEDKCSQNIHSHNKEFDLDPLPEDKSSVVTFSYRSLFEACDVAIDVLLQTDGVQHQEHDGAQGFTHEVEIQTFSVVVACSAQDLQSAYSDVSN